MNIYGNYSCETQFSYFTTFALGVQIVSHIIQMCLIIRNEYNKNNYDIKMMSILLSISIILLMTIDITKKCILSCINTNSLLQSMMIVVFTYIFMYFYNSKNKLCEYENLWTEYDLYFICIICSSFIITLHHLNIENILYILCVLYLISVVFIHYKFNKYSSYMLITFAIVALIYNHTNSRPKITNENKREIITDISGAILEKTNDFTIIKDTNSSIYLTSHDGEFKNTLIGNIIDGTIYINENLEYIPTIECRQLAEDVFINKINELNILFNNQFNILNNYNIISQIDDINYSFNVEFTPNLDTYSINSPFFIEHQYNSYGVLLNTYLRYNGVIIGEEQNGKMIININAIDLECNKFIFDIINNELYVLIKNQYIKYDYDLLNSAGIKFAAYDNEVLRDVKDSKYTYNNSICKFDNLLFDADSGILYYKNNEHKILKVHIAKTQEYCDMKICVFNPKLVEITKDNKVKYNGKVIPINVPYCIDSTFDHDGMYILLDGFSGKLINGNIPHFNCYFNKRNKLKFIKNANDDCVIGGFSPTHNNTLNKDIIAIYEIPNIIQVIKNKVYYEYQDTMFNLGDLDYLQNHNVYIITMQNNVVYYYDKNGQKQQFNAKSSEQPLDTLNEVFYRDIFINI
jgi:hypothetical protein